MSTAAPLRKPTSQTRPRPALEGEAHEFYGTEEPPPVAYVVDSLVPTGYLTIVYAPGGAMKSLEALHLGLCVALGRPFLGLDTVRGRVLLYDLELGFEVHAMRAARILRGLGLSLDDPGLRGQFDHYRPRWPLSTAEGLDELARAVAHFRPDLLVLDSLSIGSAGADLSSARDMSAVLEALVRLPATVLALDHTPKNLPPGALGTPFGSAFKFHYARAVYALVSAKDGSKILVQTKSSFGGPAPPVAFRAEFDDESRTTWVVPVEPSGARAGAPEPATETTLRAIVELHGATGEPVTVADVHEWRLEDAEVSDLSLGTVRNHVSELKRAGRIVPDDGVRGGYVPA